MNFHPCQLLYEGDATASPNSAQVRRGRCPAMAVVDAYLPTIVGE